MADSATNLDTVSQSVSQREVQINALIDAASPATIFGRRASTCSGLVFGYYGGEFGSANVANGTVTATASNTNYVVVHRTTLVVSIATSNTNWNDTATYGRMYLLTAGSSSITFVDYRMRDGGILLSSGGSGTVTSVNITQPAAGITASGGPITLSGSITLALANDLAALEGLSSTGFAKRTATDTWSVGSVDVSSSDVTGTLAAARFPALTGDVTTSAGAVATTIANDAVTNAKLANMAAHTFKVRKTNSTGDPEDGSATETTALLDVVVGDSGSGGTKGLVPAPAAGDAAAGKFLKADGTFAVPSGSTVTSVVTQTSSTLTITTQNVIFADATSNNITITLPAANASGTGFTPFIQIKRVDATANTVTVQRAGSDTFFDGGTSTTLISLEARTFLSDGSSKWGFF